MEFGVRWGQNLALFESFRGIYEPYNYSVELLDLIRLEASLWFLFKMEMPIL